MDKGKSEGFSFPPKVCTRRGAHRLARLPACSAQLVGDTRSILQFYVWMAVSGATGAQEEPLCGCWYPRLFLSPSFQDVYHLLGKRLELDKTL